MKYPSIENLYSAVIDEKGRPTSRGPENGFQLEAFGQIAKWNVEEKLDGTNVRIVFEENGFENRDADTWSLTFRGRTDKAVLPGGLQSWLQDRVEHLSLWDAFARPVPVTDVHGEKQDLERTCVSPIILYGEGIGPKIQAAGAGYGGVQRFVLFDVLIGNTWLRRDDVEGVADTLGLEVAPLLLQNVGLDQARGAVHSAMMQTMNEHIEGVVLKTDPPLYDSRGRRVMAKYKVRDLG